MVPGLSTDGALSVAVPGAVAGYLELLERTASCRAAVVLAPAIEAARKGFWVTPKYQRWPTRRLECLRQDAEAARLFLAKKRTRASWTCRPWATCVRQPELARHARGAREARAPKAFYAGPLARRWWTR